ncbi:hypothetical protein SRHO_G00252930 [Serrasalmus rhombeus]
MLAAVSFILIRPDGWNLHFSPSGQREGHGLLIVCRFVYEERIEWLFPFIPQSLSREREEHGVAWVKETEVPVLGERQRKLHPLLTASSIISSIISMD